MKTVLIPAVFSLAMGVLLAVVPVARSAEAGRETIPLDRDWRFHRGEVANGQATGLDDSAWRRLDVPHDWSRVGYASA
jgi:beta-galactosidase